MNPLLITTAEAASGKNPLVALTPGLYIWTIITFLLLLYLLAKFAWKPLLKMLEERENLIKSSLDDAEKAKLELERLNEESEKIMAKARVEAQEILAEGKTTAEKVKEDTISKAKEAAKQRREKALARPDRKPNMKNGVDVMRNKKDDEHFASDFEYKADQGHDIDKITQDVKNQYQEQKKKLSKRTETQQNKKSEIEMKE